MNLNLPAVALMIISLSWIAPPLAAADATDDQLLGYYPLKAGNWWKYKCSNDSGEVTLKITVSKFIRKDGEAQAQLSFVPAPKRENARLLLPILEDAVSLKADGLYSDSGILFLKAPPEVDTEWTDTFNAHMVQKYYAKPDSEDGLPSILRGQNIKDVVGIAKSFDMGSSVKLFVKGIGLVNSSVTVGGSSTICDLIAWKKPEVKKKPEKAP